MWHCLFVLTHTSYPLFRYVITSAAFLPNPTYYQSANFTGFANMTSAYNNVGIYISKPRLLDCADISRQKVTGLTPSFLDDTFIDIEPFTGYGKQHTHTHTPHTPHTHTPHTHLHTQ